MQGRNAMVVNEEERRQNGQKVRLPQGLDLAAAVFYAALLLWGCSVLMDMVSGKIRFWPMLAGIVFFQACNKALARFVDSNPSCLQRLAYKSRPLFLNTAVSLLHSFICAVSVVVLLVKEWRRTGLAAMATHEQLVGGGWQGILSLLCFTCGYFAYDQWDMLQKHLYDPRSPGILLHHVVFLVCVTMAVSRDVTLNYLALTLICEVHSVFLHQRKVSKLAGFTTGGTAFANMLWAFNWITFFVTRLLVHLLITGKIVHDASLFPPGPELPVSLIGMILLNVLNILLGSDMYKAFKRDMAGRVQKQA